MNDLLAAFILLGIVSAPLAESRPTSPDEGYLATPDGVRLFYRSLGEGADVVLLPGAVYLYDDFKRYAQGRRLIAYDLRNRGRSDAVVDSAKLRRGVHQDAEDLEAVRTHFGVKKVAVLAHSYVGVVAALYAMKHPEHVSRVVQISPAPPSFGKQQSLPQDAQAMFAAAFARVGELQNTHRDDPAGLCRESWRALAPIYVADRRYASSIERWGSCELANERNALKHFNGNILPTLKSLAITREQLAQASMPVLTIHGTLDRSAPYGGGRDWATLLPNARLLTIEGVGHAPWIEAPERVFDPIEVFLRGEWPQAATAVQP